MSEKIYNQVVQMSEKEIKSERKLRVSNGWELEDVYFDSISDVYDEIETEEVEVFYCPICDEKWEDEYDAEMCCEINY